MQSRTGTPTISMPPVSQTGGVPEFFVDVPINLGSPFFGMWLSAILFGLLSLQTWRYFQEYPRDGNVMKLLIIALWVLDALDLGLITYAVYRCAVLFFGDVLALVQLVWTVIVHGGLSSVITFLVQAFFTRRIWVLSQKNTILTLAIATFSLISLGAGLHYMIRSFAVVNDLGLLPRYSKGTFITSAVVADILIAGSQCYYLGRNKVGSKRLGVTVKLMMAYIVNTMLLTTAVALLELVLWVSRNDSTHLVPDWTICRIYSNSLLAVVNTRSNIRQRLEADPELGTFVAVSHAGASTTWHRTSTAINTSTATVGQNFEMEICHSHSSIGLSLLPKSVNSIATQTSE